MKKKRDRKGKYFTPKDLSKFLMGKSNYKMLNLSDIKRKVSPVREELVPWMSEWALGIHHALGDELVGPFEQFEYSFCKDSNPGKELFVWATIAATLRKWEINNPLLTSKNKRKTIFKYLLSFTIGSSVPDTEKVNKLKDLMLETKKELLEAIENNIDD